ncbi:MAG TPA: DsbA family protein [Allosphingosinicella sp.]|nr:DsbA family protein [Allosphingosinicella sp.]
MKANWFALIAGIGGALIGAGAVALAGAGGAGVLTSEEARVERIVRDYILANPELIPEAMKRLQERQLADVVDAHRAAFETPFGSAWAGAEQGDVVLVEFYDYACGYCRKSIPDLARLLREDDRLKIVWRELPVLGPDSEAAAEMSLAAARQGRFQAFHDKLFALGRPSAEALSEAAAAAGVTPKPGAPEWRAEIEKNYGLARLINATGTPTFVVGDKVLQGAVGYEALKEAIAEARQG